MERNAELLRLEECVDKLLAQHVRLREEYRALQETLRQRELECAELKRNVLDLSSERTEVGNRVSGLLDRIEQWENEQQTTEADGNGEPSRMSGSD
ncbi:MAG: cell division protein ZapB [Desulfobulbus sp.]|jgi:chromosome segregation ATPase